MLFYNMLRGKFESKWMLFPKLLEDVADRVRQFMKNNFLKALKFFQEGCLKQKWLRTG